MAQITCSLDAIADSASCKPRGGIRTIYWTEYSNVDWDAMAIDALDFDTATQEVLGYTMVGAATFTEVAFERKGSFYDVTYTEEASSYAQLITLIFEGKDQTRRNSLVSATLCCQIIVHTFDNNGIERVFGVDWDGDNFSKQVRSLRVGRHLDSSGDLGNSLARDEVDLVGESYYAPLWASVTEANMPT